MKLTNSRSAQSLAPSVAEFINRIGRIENVRCVVVDNGDRVIEITTFAEPLTEETRDAVYAVEVGMIDDFPELVFDFHLRDASDLQGVPPDKIPGVVAVWGSPDENSGRTPETGQR